MFVFMRAYAPQHPDLFINQVTLLGLITVLFVSAWVLFKDQERYL